MRKSTGHNKTIKLSTRYISILLLIIFFSLPSWALSQTGDNTMHLDSIIIRHESGYKTTSLRIGAGAGYGIFRDMGTSPVSFKGLLLTPAVGLEWSGMRKWTTELSVITTTGIFEDAVDPRLNFGSFDIGNSISFRMLRNVANLYKRGCDDDPLLQRHKTLGNISLGFGMANFLDVTVNSAYENAAAGVSEFLGPELTARADFCLNSRNYDRFDKGLHAELSLLPVAAIMRPGYAYIDNYTASQPVLSALFDEYEWNIKPLAGISTEVGIDIFTGLGSRISIAYLWKFHSTGDSGFWRFDHATHALLVDFYITLKQKSACLTTVK